MSPGGLPSTLGGGGPGSETAFWGIVRSQSSCVSRVGPEQDGCGGSSQAQETSVAPGHPRV